MNPLTCTDVEAELAAHMGAPTDTLPAILARHLVDCDACMRLARELESPVVAAAFDEATAGADLVELTTVPRDHYFRVTEIGRGGMGRIVRARDRRLGRSVAIKELLDERLRARFEREARLTARLQHPAIVSVHEAGRWPSGEPFYAMKFVAGRPLDQVIAGTKTLAERLTLLPHFTTVVEAIAYAHSERVIHRDIKPHNILIGAFGETVVIDWGLAKELGAPDDGPTPYREERGAFTVGGAGTPAYMAPEQARGDVPDERVDVYSLGATLHHLLAGKQPDDARLGEEVPAELRAIVAKASAEERDDRYRTASDLAAELRRYQNGQLVGAHRYSSSEHVRRFVRRHRTVVSLSALFGLSLVAVGIVSLTRIIAEHDRAEAAAIEAGAQRDRAARSLAEALAERGRVELIGSAPARALPYLQTALAGGLDTPEVRLLLGEAERSLAALVLSTDGSTGSAALDPSGTRLAVAGPGTVVRILAIPSGDVLHTLAGHSKTVAFLAWRPNGTQLATAASSSGDDVARIWNADSGQLAGSLRAGGIVSGLAFAPDGRLAVATRHRAAVWDGENTVWLDGHTDDVHSVAFDATGARILTASGDGTARIWNAGGKVLVTLSGHSSGVATAWFDEAGTAVVTAGNDHRAAVWNAATGERKAWLDFDSGSTIEAVFAPTGDHVVARTAWLVRLFGSDGRKLADLDCGAQPTSVAWAGPETIAVAARDGSIRLFDAGGAPRGRLDGHVGAAWGLTVGRGGTLVASAGADGTAKVWSAWPSAVIASALAPGAPAAMFDAGGRLMTVMGHDLADVWDASTGNLITALPHRTARLIEAQVVRVAGGGMGVLVEGHKLWDAASGAGRELDAGERIDRGVFVTGMTVGKLPRSMAQRLHGGTNPSYYSLSVWFVAPDGRRFAGLDLRRRTASIHDSESGAEIASFEESALINGIIFSADASRLVVYGDFGEPELRDATTGQLLGIFRGHRGGVKAAATSGDGRYLLTVGEDRTARLYAVSTQDALLVMANRGAPTVALDEHGTRAYVGGVLYRLDSEPRDAAAIERFVADRNLYALDGGRLVPHAPAVRFAGTLPPAPLPAGARAPCPAGLIPHGALFPFDRVAWCSDIDSQIDIPVGPRTVWYPSGTIAQSQSFTGSSLMVANGRLFEDNHRIFDPQGHLSEEVFDEGPDHRMRRTFHPNGAVASETETTRGRHHLLMDISFRAWHPNGALAEEGRPLDAEADAGQSRGRIGWTTWDQDGRKRSEGTYFRMLMADERTRIGVWQFWNRRGDVTAFDFGCSVRADCGPKKSPAARR